MKIEGKVTKEEWDQQTARITSARIRRKLLHRVTRDEALKESPELQSAWRKVKPLVGKALTAILREEIK